ncbi:hypothetical protein ACFWY9_28575 [Amycolatopsis sp. NPDC059027]|uniref:hypothetical protein n=1 Tax=Amycolatopsis sp. NPDC059027 TaxID=3346709 RepID=UPI00366F9160
MVDEVFLSADPTWETEIGQKGSWGVELYLGTPNSKDNVLTYMTSGAHSWVLLYKDIPIQGGMPGDGSFSQDKRTLNVSGPGMLGVFDNRIVRAAGASPSTITSSDNNYSLAGVSSRRVLSELVSRSLADSASGAGLPFDTTDGASETGSTARSFAAWDFNTVLKKMNDETDAVGGCEFIVRPYLYFVSGAPYIGWKLALGSPLLGDASLAAVWEFGAAFGNIDVDYNLSIPRPHRVWSKGSGDGGSAVVGYAENSAALQAAGVIYSDYVDTVHNDVGVKTTLDGYASGILSDRSQPLETWNAEVRIDGKNSRGAQVSPELGGWAEGDKPLLRITDHPVIPDGSYRRRIVGMSNGSGPGLVKLKIQPEPSA